MTTATQVNTIIPSGDIRVDSLQDDPAIWNYLLPTRNILYYTFDASAGSYIDTKTSAVVTAFNTTQKDAACAILSYASSLIGVTFSEVVNSDTADIHFGACDLVGSTVSGQCKSGWSYSYAGDETITSLSAEAIVYLDNAEFFADNNLPTMGTEGYQVLLHEIGHMLGLGHPFEGNPLLPVGQDNTDNTVMSYTWTGANKSTYQSYDQLALEWIYGGDGIGGNWGYNSVNGNSLSLSDPAPILISTSPADNANDIAISANLVFNFSEAVQAGSGNLRIYDSAGVLVCSIDVTDSSQVNFSGSSMTLNPITDLDAGTSYYINIDSGVVKDMSNNAFTGISSTSAFNFTTLDVIPSYTLSADTNSVDEGDTASFTLSTTGVADGTVLNYTIWGISELDVTDGLLSGSLTINNNTATISIPIAADMTPEGAETLTVDMYVESTYASASVIINDTSTVNPTLANDLLAQLQSSSASAGVQFSQASLLGSASQVSMFASLNLSPELQMGKGILLTSGNGNPPKTSTSDGYGESVGGLGDEAMSAIAVQAFPGAGSTNDASILEFSATVTDASVTTLAVDLIFGSEEYPEYADSSYVDIAAVIVNGVNYGLFSNGSPLSITTANNAFNNVTANEGLPIEYDGLSGRLTVFMPVTLGTNQIRIGVADTGDNILDSGLFLSNLRALSDNGSEGVKLEIVAPSTGGEVSSSAPSEPIAEIFSGSTNNDTFIAGAGDDYAGPSGGNDTFLMGEGNDYAQGGAGNDTFEGGVGYDILEGGDGEDTFKGSVSDFDGDIINDFSTDDMLLFSNALLTLSNFSFSSQSASAYSSASIVGGLNGSSASTVTATASQTFVSVDANNDGAVDASFVLKGSFSSANFKVSSLEGDTVMTYGSTNTTQAKVYLGQNDNFTISDSATTLYGSSGVDVVTLTDAATSVVLDQNVDNIRFANASSSYTFKQTGNMVNVYDTTGSLLLVNVSVQDDADGTLLTFSDGTASAKLSAGIMMLGGAALSDATPSTLNPTLSTNPTLPNTPSSAKVYLGQNDQFTLNSSGTTLYGSSGIDKVTLAANVNSTALDQNVDEVVFLNASSNYRFKQTDDKINIYDATGSTLLTSLPVQSDTDGTLLTFSNGTASAKLSAGIVTLRLATATVSSTAATAPQPFSNDINVVSDGNLPNVDNSSYTDGVVELNYANDGQVRLIGLANATDSLADFDAVF